MSDPRALTTAEFLAQAAAIPVSDSDSDFDDLAKAAAIPVPDSDSDSEGHGSGSDAGSGERRAFAVRPPTPRPQPPPPPSSTRRGEGDGSGVDPDKNRSQAGSHAAAGAEGVAGCVSSSMPSALPQGSSTSMLRFRGRLAAAAASGGSHDGDAVAERAVAPKRTGGPATETGGGALAAQADDDEAFCRICRSGSEAGKLYAPCRCAGSIKWIHESCLSKWLKTQDRKPVCELCLYNFEFQPVYVQHAPQRLTLSDWAGALGASAFSLGSRLARMAYATALWGIALPMLTFFAASCTFGGRPHLLTDMNQQALPFTVHIFLGECLSLAGILVIYVSIVLRDLFPELAPDRMGAEGGAGVLALATDAREGPLRGDDRGSLGVGQGPGVAAGAEAAASVPVAPVAQAPLRFEQRLATQRAPATGPRPPPPYPSDAEDVWADDEELWIMMGLQGSPCKALVYMVSFFLANVIGIVIFLAIPYWVGRLSLYLMSVLFPVPHLLVLGTEAVAADYGEEGVMEPGAMSNSTNSTSWSETLPPAVDGWTSDFRALLLGYCTLFVVFVFVIPTVILFTSAFGCNMQVAEDVRRTMHWLMRKARVKFARTWVQLQMLIVDVLQLVVLPCFVGHIVLCAISGPVLHVSTERRAEFAKANMLLTIVMELFVGYLHLWGVSCVDGCFIDVCAPWVSRQMNFYLDALSSQRRVFYLPSTSVLDAPLAVPRAQVAGDARRGGVRDGHPFFGAAVAGADRPLGQHSFGRDGAGSAAPAAPPQPEDSGYPQTEFPRLMVIKLLLAHAALHSAIALLAWRPPALALDALVGSSLFPVQLLERVDLLPADATAAETVPAVAAAIAGNTTNATSAASPGQGNVTQHVLVAELLHLYILVLQCLRMFDACPGIARLFACVLRCTLRRLGLGHLLPTQQEQEQASPPQDGAAGEGVQHQPDAASPPQDGAAGEGFQHQPDAVATAQPEKRNDFRANAVMLGQFVSLALLLTVSAWLVVASALSLPLYVGRALVRQIIAEQASRVSDVFPLSVGVTVLSAGLLAAAKICEAVPVLISQARSVRNRRFAYFILCGASCLAMLVAAFLLLPVGMGSLILRMVVPLKARAMYSEPNIFLITECWSLGLVCIKVLWRMLQTDMIMRGLHTQLVALWNQSQGSFAGLFFNLSAHGRLWRILFLPMFEALAVHLFLPQAFAHTMLWCCVDESQEVLAAGLTMYSYHVVLAIRLGFSVVPMLCEWVTAVRQRIFDSKYLVSRELQNYHQDAIELACC